MIPAEKTWGDSSLPSLRTARTFNCSGLRVSIAASQPSLLDSIVAMLEPEIQPTVPGEVDVAYQIKEEDGAVGGEKYSLFEQEQLVGCDLNFAAALQLLERELHHFVAQHSKDHVFIHAGVVGWAGQAILLPGQTYSGKSTVVMELVRAGARYYSDEYAVIDPSGRVHPFRRPIRLRDPRGGINRIPIGNFGESEPTGAVLEARLILFTTYQRCGRWDMTRLSEGEAMMGLIQNTVAARVRVAASMRAAAQLARSAKAFAGTRGESAESVAEILNLLCGNASA